VATGDRNWKELLDSFYGDFKKRLNTAASAEGMRRNQPVEVPSVACPYVDVPCRFVQVLQAYS
jgi:DNA topoisomerase-1